MRIRLHFGKRRFVVMALDGQDRLSFANLKPLRCDEQQRCLLALPAQLAKARAQIE
ncbi:MAG: hypothetical protein ABR508_03030 [Candidatus Baltobacteraceae bacterium]